MGIAEDAPAIVWIGVIPGSLWRRRRRRGLQVPGASRRKRYVDVEIRESIVTCLPLDTSSESSNKSRKKKVWLKGQKYMN